MFLYRFVCRRRRRPHLLVHAITFEQLFRFLSFLAPLLALTCRLPDWIFVDFRCDLDLDFSRSNMEFVISQSKMVRLPWNEKQTYRLNSSAQMWPSGLTLAMTLTLNFQGQIWNLLYLSQKWSDCHGTKSKHIDWTLRLQMWPSNLTLAMTLTLNFQKVKYGIFYISAKCGSIATKRKANISIELQAWNVTNGFDFDHNLDLWNLKVKHDLDLWPHTWPWPWIYMVKFWNSCILEWEGRLTLHKECGSRSFMTMTMTIWWLRSGVWIYQIVTGVTSVVGVPSTHLVVNWTLGDKLQWNYSGNIVCEMAVVLSRGRWVKKTQLNMYKIMCIFYEIYCCLLHKPTDVIIISLTTPEHLYAFNQHWSFWARLCDICFHDIFFVLSGKLHSSRLGVSWVR